MAYQIPQKLQYEEKIVFGLSIKQMAYLAAFSAPAAIISLKTDLNIYLKAIISFMMLSLSSLFMFLDTGRYILAFISWIRFREAGLMDKKMKDFIGINNVSKGVIYATYKK